MTTTRRTVHGRDIAECPTCRDATVLGMDAAADEAWFRARHRNCKPPEKAEGKMAG